MILTEVYAAGEAPIVAADGRALTRAIRLSSRHEPLFVPEVADLPAAVLGLVQPGDVVITMGAGSIGATCGQIVAQATQPNPPSRAETDHD